MPSSKSVEDTSCTRTLSGPWLTWVVCCSAVVTDVLPYKPREKLKDIFYAKTTPTYFRHLYTSDLHRRQIGIKDVIWDAFLRTSIWGFCLFHGFKYKFNKALNASEVKHRNPPWIQWTGTSKKVHFCTLDPWLVHSSGKWRQHRPQLGDGLTCSREMPNKACTAPFPPAQSCVSQQPKMQNELRGRRMKENLNLWLSG